MTEAKKTTFKSLKLNPTLADTVKELGYEHPTPIQEQVIPLLLKTPSQDIIGQAQTGSGKTAAFALPILSKIDISIKQPQALIIAPTRELAIQVAEAFQSYAKNLKGFHVAPIYGGQDYQIQLRALKRGLQVVVGTPGRVMDHMRRGTLSTDNLNMLVLDEADEMLKMGFIDDIEWILEQINQPHQTALFSATMPSRIQNIAEKYLKKPTTVKIKHQANTSRNIEQFYITMANNQKLDVLTRVLEVEETQAIIIFVRTKNNSAELAEKLQARGYAAAALNGDMSQSAREKVLSRIKSGSLDIIIATDVAARGIDVERISHVINYDIPHDVESYIHRIGRTGRAGRKGKALLFTTPREKRLLHDIDNTMPTPITKIAPPSLQEMTERRNKQLTEKINNIVSKSKKIKPYYKVVKNIIENSECENIDITAALLFLLDESNPLPAEEIVIKEGHDRNRNNSRNRNQRNTPRGRQARNSGNRRSSSQNRDKPKKRTSKDSKAAHSKRQRPRRSKKA